MEGSNLEADNSRGFTAIPSGYRSYLSGSFNSIANESDWWSDTEFNIEKAYFYWLNYYSNYASLYLNLKVNGFPIRCVKD